MTEQPRPVNVELIQHQLGEISALAKSTDSAVQKQGLDIAVLSAQLTSLRKNLAIGLTVFLAPIVVTAILVALRLGK